MKKLNPLIRRLILAVVGLTVVYVLAYFAFTACGCIPYGSDLEKSDWLLFMGSFLTLSGSVIVAVIATMQTETYRSIDNERMASARHQEIQPILSISIAGINSQIIGAAEAFSLKDGKSNLKHDNVTLKFKNLGNYAITSVVAFDSVFLVPSLGKDEDVTFQFTFPDTEDAQKDAQRTRKLLKIIPGDVLRDAAFGIPKKVQISYIDADATPMMQEFNLTLCGEEKYYAFSSIIRQQ